jgi:signal transduction histidine kinase
LSSHSRRWHKDYVIKQALGYSVLVILISVSYALLVSGLSIALKDVLAPGNLLIHGVVFFVLALLFSPMHNALEKTVNAIFFRTEQTFNEDLQTFSGELTNELELSQITQIFGQYIKRTLRPSFLHIFIQDLKLEQFIATPDQQGQISTDIQFASNSALPQTLQLSEAPLVLKNLNTLPANLQPDQVRINILGAQVFIPLSGSKTLTGWLALGPKLSGKAYSSGELYYLEALCHQTALAIERTQVIVNYENRMHEMNILARISEGVNVTLSLDDILELIYAQTTQIIPADDFRITLLDKETGACHNLFFVEANERLNHFENQYFTDEQSLELEVIQRRIPILTDSYTKECQKRGIISSDGNIHAYISVPLNSGAETIGALSLSKRDPTVIYTNEQRSLLESIADQAAGAIIKTRLIEETERRARQFSTLNEVARKLSSTLEHEPLLQSILNSAVDILICEAGSLLMVDDETDELVFRVTVGPVANDLLNTRLPAGSGMVGKAVSTQQPIIVNNIRSSQEWFSQTDKQTGFTTTGLLVVPMLVKEKVIGVLEVLNKKDGTPFNIDDQELLRAFAAQAAIALENAYLYTITDQELTARVEELSVMQRIDRELNTSLDTTQAMRITLDWAMRHSNATAGIVGMVQENNIRIIASQGYTNELAAYPDSIIPADVFELNEVIERGTPFHATIKDEKSGLLTGVTGQINIPIRRESATIGVLMLESDHPESITEDTINFLVRLGDHASIAISNAVLYAAVQAANVAKSEFVSFVSHELKNPMTSIKGYTELLASSAVGPITDAQMNFLQTIKSNVERMNTLVSDLADVSRIEAGRLRLEFTAFSLTDVLAEVIKSIKNQMDDKKQVLDLNIAAELPEIWADRMRIVQILTNLVSNAYKYTQLEGKIVVRAEVCDNQWDEKGAPTVMHISVKDNGIGINEEDQKKIFQKFFRSEDSKAREAPGTGLGLNITKYLVEMQGGRIWFESVMRTGTTFHFTIPIAVTEEANAGQADVQ